MNLALTSVRQRGRHYPRRCLLRTSQQALPYVIKTGCSSLQDAAQGADTVSDSPNRIALGPSWSPRCWSMDPSPARLVLLQLPHHQLRKLADQVGAVCREHARPQSHT